MGMAAKDRPIVAIDLLRFACALLVVGCHYGESFWFQPGPHVAAALTGVDATRYGWPVAKAGAVGVELFFIISGVVIARSAIGLRWTDFLRRRALRLLPAAWICATATLIVLAAVGQGDLALVSAWFRSVRFWPVGDQIDESYWTLGVELAFYLFVTLWVGAGGSWRRIERAGIVLGTASALFWLGCWLIGRNSADVMTNQAVVLLLLPHGCLFALGIAIEVALARGATPARLGWVGALALLAMSETAGHMAGWRVSPAMVVAEILLVAGIATLLAARRLQPMLARMISPEAARAVGVMTYPLYLIHQDIGAVMIGGLMRGGVGFALAATGATVAALAMAWLVARHLEPALRRPLARWLSGPPFKLPSRGPLRTSA